MNRLVLALLAIPIVTALASPAPADNWPAWRGDGSGVSPESGLPDQWEVDHNVIWKAPIEGEGISSPIIWQDRIFVTTANQGTRAVVSHTIVFAVGGGLLLLALAAAVALFRAQPREHSGSDQESLTPRFIRAMRLLDRVATILALTLFVLSLVAILVKPELVATGSINRAWLTSGLIGMMGLIGAIGLQSPGSVWRPVGSAVMVVAAVSYILAVPDTRGANPIELEEMLTTSGPLVVAAAWNLLVFFLSRRREGRERRPVTVAVGCLSLIALIGLQFAFLNYMRPRIEFMRSVVSIDRRDGTIIWQRPVFVAPRGQKHISNSFASPTPVTDGQHVVAGFGLGLASLDFDGNIEWKIEEPTYFDWVRYGAGSSPVIWKDLLIYSFFPEYQGPEVGRDYSVKGHMTAVDKATGELRWTTVPLGAHDSYSTPLLVRIDDRDAIVILTGGYVLAFDAETGDEIWKCAVPIMQGVPSIVADKKRAFVIGGTHGPKGGVAIELEGSGDITATNLLWTVNQGIPMVPSPVLYEGLLYMVTDSGIATCLDTADGTRVWRKRLPGNYTASPVAGDGKIYFSSMEGTTIVIRAGREYEELAQNALDEEILASPAISDGQLFVRTKNHLYCIGAG